MWYFIVRLYHNLFIHFPENGHCVVSTKAITVQRMLLWIVLDVFWCHLSKHFCRVYTWKWDGWVTKVYVSSALLNTARLLPRSLCHAWAFLFLIIIMVCPSHEVRPAPGLPGKNRWVNWYGSHSVCQLLFSLIKCPPVIHFFRHYFSCLGPESTVIFSKPLTCINITICKWGLGGPEESQYQGSNLHRTYFPLGLKYLY